MAMKKNEVLDVIKNGLELKSKKEAGELLNTIDLVVEALVDALDPSEKVAIGSYIVLEKKSLPAQEGVAMGKTWSKPAREEMMVKRSARLKRILEEKVEE